MLLLSPFCPKSLIIDNMLVFMYVCMYVLAHIYMCRLERERHVGAHEHLLITACRDEEEATNLITSIAFERILRLAY
jgi:hypothetical protein